MSNIKTFTDLEQSKKLAEILPLESADMCYRIVAYNLTDTHVYQPYCFSCTLKSDIPCWSLAALLEIIANTAAYIDEDGYLDTTVCKNVHCVSLINCNGELYKADNLVDACYEMILKLHELKLL